MERSHRLLIVWVLGLLNAQLAAGAPGRIPVIELFGNPRYSVPELSGDGKSLAFVVSEGDVQVVAPGPIEAGLARRSPRVAIEWLARLLLQHVQKEQVASRRRFVAAGSEMPAQEKSRNKIAAFGHWYR